MIAYQQLELFDTRPYTSEQPIAIDKEEEPVTVTPQMEHKQLELNLFPQKSHNTPLEWLSLAA
ncbi:hypothetical protein [[Phormidium] sp. ETS-05]|uniref:hypothetical protein n=1 Tax=[Phormidium] sp. ETS-05 TaxID=222819 RepID=UPI0018EEE29B|nr:hypothetical protein [[Phormidium] sp. ETS-05]